jgi:hypothetical protein
VPSLGQTWERGLAKPALPSMSAELIFQIWRRLVANQLRTRLSRVGVGGLGWVVVVGGVGWLGRVGG